MKEMVSRNLVVASDVCGSLDTQYYQRKPICYNKTITAIESGVHILMDAQLTYTPWDATLPQTTECNQITANPDDCRDDALDLVGTGDNDGAYSCDRTQCQAAPPLDPTDPPNITCEDNDEALANLTGNLLTYDGQNEHGITWCLG